MLCASLLSQGTGKTLWKPPKDGLGHLEQSSGRIQRLDAHPMYLPPCTHHAWKPTGTGASTMNLHPPYTKKTGGLTTSIATDPLLPAAGRKAPSLFLPPPKLAAPFPCSLLTLCPHQLLPLALPGLPLPSCSTRHGLTKAAGETQSYFLPDCFFTCYAQQGSWKRA